MCVCVCVCVLCFEYTVLSVSPVCIHVSLKGSWGGGGGEKRKGAEKWTGIP